MTPLAKPAVLKAAANYRGQYGVPVAFRSVAGPVGGRDERQIIGGFVRRWRKLAKLTGKDLADAIGTSFQTIHKIETGQSVTAHRLAAIARALGRPIADFYPADLRQGGA